MRLEIRDDKSSPKALPGAGRSTRGTLSAVLATLCRLRETRRPVVCELVLARVLSTVQNAAILAQAFSFGKKKRFQGYHDFDSDLRNNRDTGFPLANSCYELLAEDNFAPLDDAASALEVQ